jgi:hypothetical protein
MSKITLPTTVLSPSMSCTQIVRHPSRPRVDAKLIRGRSIGAAGVGVREIFDRDSSLAIRRSSSNHRYVAGAARDGDLVPVRGAGVVGTFQGRLAPTAPKRWSSSASLLAPPPTWIRAAKPLEQRTVMSLAPPFTLTIGFLDSCRMLRSDNAQPQEEQLRSGK